MKTSALFYPALILLLFYFTPFSFILFHILYCIFFNPQIPFCTFSIFFSRCLLLPLKYSYSLLQPQRLPRSLRITANFWEKKTYPIHASLYKWQKVQSLNLKMYWTHFRIFWGSKVKNNLTLSVTCTTTQKVFLPIGSVWRLAWTFRQMGRYKTGSDY